MKKYTLVLVLMAILPIVSASGYEYVKDSSGDSYTSVRPVKASAYKKTITNRNKGGYHNTITNNFYYNQTGAQQYAKPRVMPVQEDYYDDEEPQVIRKPVMRAKKQVAKKKEYRSSAERKYFLAHPFFQPLKGNFGSVTDVAYSQNNFKFDMLPNGYIYGVNPNYEKLPVIGGDIISGKQQTSQFLVKEDISFGLSDTLALIGMVQYDKTKVAFKDWFIPASGESIPDDSMSSSGLNVFGIGVQDRFIDNDEWIGMIAGSFLHQKDTANIFLGELKVGYKVSHTTLYGLANIRYLDITKGDTYGAFVKDKTGDYLMLTYNTDVSGAFEIEGGAGVFSVLGKYITLNGELIYGHYDWHEQINIKGAIGWQPGDSFALNLYASTTLYDSAKNKTKSYISYDLNPEAYPDGWPYPADCSALYTIADYKIKNYNEWKVGLQAVLYF